MSDAEKPEDSKPVFTVFPRGMTAEEIAEALRALLEKHVGKRAEEDGPDEGG